MKIFLWVIMPQTGQLYPFRSLGIESRTVANFFLTVQETHPLELEDLQPRNDLPEFFSERPIRKYMGPASIHPLQSLIRLYITQ